MMSQDFDNFFPAALSITLQFEGGWYPGHLAGDPNPTMRGITQRTYSLWRKERGLPDQSVRHISDEEVSAIYRERFWDRAQCGKWPWPMNLLVFDWAVNSGPKHALSALPSGLDSQRVDNESCRLYLLRRWEFLERLMRARPETKVFRRGWARRVNALCSIVGIQPVAVEK